MRVYYDLHIHTAASPCADELMSPHNIVNMAKLKGLDVIAITDHQTVCNCEAVQKIGRLNDLLVIPGIEIECAEEFHLIALLPSCHVAQQIATYVQEAMPKIQNNKQLFGPQQCFNTQDEVICEIDNLLLVASKRSAVDITKKVVRAGGIIYPAHIDRRSYSIMSQLGILPQVPVFEILEISRDADKKQYMCQYPKHHIIQSSDAHYLQDISEANHFLELSERSVTACMTILKALKGCHKK